MSETSNHRAIFRASFLTGGSQLIGLAISLVKNKVIAVCTGPAGIGFAAILNHIFGLMQAAATLGIPAAGARSVALDRDDPITVGLNVRAVRYACTVLAGFVALFAACVSPLLSYSLFGDYRHMLDMLILVVSLLFAQTAAAEQTILRGLGQVGVLAKINVTAAAVGGAMTLPCVYFWGIRGIAPSMLAASVSLYWFSRHASAKFDFELHAHSQKSVVDKAWALAKVGTTFFGLGAIGMLLNLGLSYMIQRQEGIVGNGIYQSATALTVTIASFVLSAMGQDFFPKIVSLLGKGLKREVALYCGNQIEMALLMALPILAVVSFFSHELVRIAYTSSFHAADPLVGVMAASCWARICYWPHMLCMLAEANAARVLLSELGFALIVALFSWLSLTFFGVAGVAWTYAACFLIYSIVVSWIVARITGHMPLRAIWRFYTIGLVLILTGYHFHSVVKIVLILLVSTYVVKRLVILLGPEHRLTRLIRGIPLIRCLAPANKS